MIGSLLLCFLVSEYICNQICYPAPHTGIAVNALIAVASLFAKNKVIARIQFSDVAKVGQLVGKANLPQRHGGVERAATREWVAQRLAAFPRMGLPDFV